MTAGYQARIVSGDSPLNENLPQLPQYRIGHSQEQLDDRRLPGSNCQRRLAAKRKFTVRHLLTFSPIFCNIGISYTKGEKT